MSREYFSEAVWKWARIIIIIIKKSSAVCIMACSCSMTVLASSAGSSQPRVLTGALRQPCSCCSQRCVVQGKGLLTVLGNLLIAPAKQMSELNQSLLIQTTPQTLTSTWTLGLSWFQFASFPTVIWIAMSTNSQKRGEMKAVRTSLPLCCDFGFRAHDHRLHSSGTGNCTKILVASDVKLLLEVTDVVKMLQSTSNPAHLRCDVCQGFGDCSACLWESSRK